METLLLKSAALLEAPLAAWILALYGLIWAVRKGHRFAMDWQNQKNDIGGLTERVKSLEDKWERDIPEMKAQIGIIKLQIEIIKSQVEMLVAKLYPEARSAETGSPTPPKSDAPASTTAPPPASKKT